MNWRYLSVFVEGLGYGNCCFWTVNRFPPDTKATVEVNRGAYLVNGPGHCGECHSPRNFMGGFVFGEHLAGGPAPEGKGYIPNLTPHKQGLGPWSAEDIAYALESGFTPEFDVLGGAMTKVQENMAKLTPGDRKAMAVYLKSVSSPPELW